jgi:hypothetical protein
VPDFIDRFSSQEPPGGIQIPLGNHPKRASMRLSSRFKTRRGSPDRPARLSFNPARQAQSVYERVSPTLEAVFRFVMRERIGTIVLSALVGHVAWHWMPDRWTALRQFPAPELDAAALVWMVRALLAIVSVAAAVWLAGRWRARATGPVTPQG